MIRLADTQAVAQSPSVTVLADDAHSSVGHGRQRDHVFARCSDSLAHILGKPIAKPPGQTFRYKDADPTVVGDVLQKRMGQTLAGFADANLLRPLGITSYIWTAAPDGLTFGAYGLYLQPHDLLKIG
jgi:CubicO group peptidase (beta-lactamase class C family)